MEGALTYDLAHVDILAGAPHVRPAPSLLDRLTAVGYGALLGRKQVVGLAAVERLLQGGTWRD